MIISILFWKSLFDECYENNRYDYSYINDDNVFKINNIDEIELLKGIYIKCKTSNK